MTSIVRAGRLDAIPVLERLRGGGSTPAVEDYLVGLRSGEDDAEKLFALRLARVKARGE